MTTDQLEPPLDTKSEDSANHHLPPVSRRKRVNVKLMLASVAMLSMSGLALFATYSVLPQSQNLGSRAASNQSEAWVSFAPPRINPPTNTLAKSRVLLRKRRLGKISTAKIELEYDASKISNLSAQIDDWAEGKPPIILEPFATTVTGTQGKASITLAAPCDSLGCYPLRRAVNTLLTLNFNAVGTSTITPTANTLITLTGLSENAYNASRSRNLMVRATN